MKKYVWLNLNTGEFSNSWSTDEIISEQSMKDFRPEGKYHSLALRDNWKLLCYECLNDDSFELYNRMKIVTNTQK